MKNSATKPPPHRSMPAGTSPCHRRPGAGFALVVTITMMVLLAVVAIGLLSLSAITLKTSSLSSAHANARANARMALMMAINRLQVEMGPDQRISANGAILSTSSVAHPHWTGVWDSWKANDPNPAGSDKPSHHSTIGAVPSDQMHPSYVANRADHFRSWLVSLNPVDQADVNSAIDSSEQLTAKPSRMPNQEHDSVFLVDEGTLGKNPLAEDRVATPLVDIASQAGSSTVTGRYSWWVGDESQKASILEDPYNQITSLSDADHLFRAQAPGSMGTETVNGLEGVVDEAQLDKLLSLKSLDLVNVDPPRSQGDPKPSELNFHHASIHNYGVLADVREGGLKRDLSTLLERNIDITESSEDFMLYQFNGDQERVPIQDLSAYYQLYDHDPQWDRNRRGGVNDDDALQVNAPDYGDASNKDRYLREYTALYRNPVPIKVQFLLGLGATRITPTERTAINQAATDAGKPGNQLRATDTYKMFLGVMPVVTLWNPNNLPLVMDTKATQVLKFSTPPFVLRFRKYRADGGDFTSNYLNLNYAIGIESTGDGRARLINPYVLQLQFAKNESITFQPGESKIFSVPFDDSVLLSEGGGVLVGNASVLQADNVWDAYGLYVASNSAPPNAPDVIKFRDSANTWGGYRLVFGEGDKIEVGLFPEAIDSRSRAVSGISEIYGAGLNFWMSDPDYLTGSTYHFRNYQLISRFGGSGWENPIIPNFNSELILNGFPEGKEVPFKDENNAILGESLYDAVERGEVRGIAMFSLMAGCESYASQTAGAAAGRRNATRPFLHGSTLAAPRITDNTKPALYDYGWEWQVDEINNVEEAIQDDGNNRGYYGGGYTSESGTTHTVQQYLPALPPISIASLSSAHLGGFSLANTTALSSPDESVPFTTSSSDTNYALRGAPLAGDFRQVTATGQGGLLPHTQQAIGNSYAHPNIPADKAFTTITQLLNTDIDENLQEATYVDHSYLVNKALWDEFFFSSITPQRVGVPLQGAASNKSAAEVAEDFLLGDGLLPNRRIVPFSSKLIKSEFDQMALKYTAPNDGFADEIASHLMVAGPFNINSTSVEAWKVLFSSLRNKPIAYLEDQAQQPTIFTPGDELDETPVNPGMLPNGEPLGSGTVSNDPNNPIEQWSRGRSLSDTEIGELAAAMVEQVKQRGPFLSLSEFINRRLVSPGSDANKLEMALKGALQAALDDEEVTINAAFRGSNGSPGPREFSAEEVSGLSGAQFPEAAAGPIAYGSTPYIDQADILRHLGSILTPRGDSYVIRAYGDSLDATGNVEARAWCEAVVQRTPEYTDGADKSHKKHGELNPSNKSFGRKFQITRFRWLNANEV